MFTLQEYTETELEQHPMTKEELFQPLKDQGITFDYAMPHDWLNKFVKVSGLSYDLVTSTTVWAYDGEWRFGGHPVTACATVRFALEEFDNR